MNLTLMDISKEAKSIQKILPENKNIKILDLGCGTGEYHVCLNNLGYSNIYGVDINTEYIKEAKRFSNNTYFIGDVCKPLKVEENSFDVVLAIEVMEHAREPCSLIENMFRYVKPDGLCYISTPNALGYEISFRLRGKKKINNSVAQYLTPSVIKGLINRLGGTVIYQRFGSRYWLKHIELIFTKKSKE